tara:strand:+ start:611 stop:799 length:189 start_codon:yes stop_codon:yes gene_type:complete
MTEYKCKCGKTKELRKATIVYIEKEWKTLEALCKCGKYMDCKTEKGIPNLIRTEDSLRKKNG